MMHMTIVTPHLYTHTQTQKRRVRLRVGCVGMCVGSAARGRWEKCSYPRVVKNYIVKIYYIKYLMETFIELGLLKGFDVLLFMGKT